MGARITTEKTIWCGMCAHWDQRPYERGLVKIWKREGWRLTRQHGWLCPSCAKKTS